MEEKDLNFEDKLWKAADKLRKKIEVHEYKYVVLGPIFLRYVSFAFEERKKQIEENEIKKFPEAYRDQVLEDREMYEASGVLYVPPKGKPEDKINEIGFAKVATIEEVENEILEVV